MAGGGGGSGGGASKEGGDMSQRVEELVQQAQQEMQQVGVGGCEKSLRGRVLESAPAGRVLLGEGKLP